MAVDQDEILSELGISSDLSEEFTKQASYYAHWGFTSVRAADRVRMLEERKELVFSQLYAEYREKNPKDSKENDCKAYIRKHSLYKEVSKKLREAEQQQDILKIAVRAFEMRRDMLIQLGAQHRAEFDSTDLSLKKKAQRASKIIRRTVRKGGSPRQGE